jgi:hypothetical protein
VAASAEAGAEQRVRDRGEPYAFMTVPGYVLPRVLGRGILYVSADAFELSPRERRGLAAENDEPWSRRSIVATRYDRAMRLGPDHGGWGS